MRSLVITFAIIAAVLHAADVDAKPRRVVVTEFDGPRRLAESGRAAVMHVLGDQYSIIAMKIWDNARAKGNRGPESWRQASKQAGVDALIEGWVQPEGRHHVLTVAVREAATGRQLDTVSVRIKDEGLTSENATKLAAGLEELLSWIDGDINEEPKPRLPEISTRNMIGGIDKRPQRVAAEEPDEFDPDRERSRSRDGRYTRGGPEDDYPPREEPRYRSRDSRDYRDDQRYRDRDEPTGRDLREERVLRANERPRREEIPRDEVASAPLPDKATSDLVTLFGPEAKESEILTDGKSKHISRPTPRYLVAAGPYVAARGMVFSYDPGSQGSPPEYPGQTLKGFAARAAVYPMPLKKQDGDLSGLGFSLDIQKSVLSVFSGMDDSGYGDYTLNHVAWETGIHYRYPVDFITFDADANFGNFSHTIVDLPASIQVPDTSYSYIGLGGRLDLNVTEGTTIGFGARYMYLLSAGDISDQDWYGAGKAWGAALDINAQIPLTRLLFVRGDVAYKRVKVEFEGSGMLTEEWGVWDVVDSSIGASATLGLKF